MEKKPVKPIVTEPKLLALHEKHGTAYFHIPNDDELFEIALIILTGRYEQGYWYYSPDKPEEPGFTQGDIDKMPVALQKNAIATLSKYKSDVAEYQEGLMKFQEIQKAVAKKDGRIAWRLLRDRSDYEYEQVKLEHYSTKRYGWHL